MTGEDEEAGALESTSTGNEYRDKPASGAGRNWKGKTRQSADYLAMRLSRCLS